VCETNVEISFSPWALKIYINNWFRSYGSNYATDRSNIQILPIDSWPHLISRCLDHSRFILHTDFWFSAVISANRSICPSDTTGKPRNGFSWNLVMVNFTEFCRYFPVLVRIDQEAADTLHEDLHASLGLSWAQVLHHLPERRMFRTEAVERNWRHILSPVQLPHKS
jgi:hypothetical protein